MTLGLGLSRCRGQNSMVMGENSLLGSVVGCLTGGRRMAGRAQLAQHVQGYCGGRATAARIGRAEIAAGRVRSRENAIKEGGTGG
jgi:hypothetical protein